MKPSNQSCLNAEETTQLRIKATWEGRGGIGKNKPRLTPALTVSAWSVVSTHLRSHTPVANAYICGPAMH